MTGSTLARFPYGAVYYRRSNPPREDWARDYAVAAEDGLNTFRHWFMWSAIEVEPAVFDWAEYDAQLDLAAKNGMKTIIAECTHSAPEWAFRQLAHTRYQRADGTRQESLMRDSSVTGGFPGLCLDNEDAKALAERWLTALATHYRGHPGLGGYDIWNETNLYSSAYAYCFCRGTHDKYIQWLEKKYGTIKAVGQAWRRHSLTCWDDIVIPTRNGPYPDCMDWLQFRLDNAWRLMKWRVATVRKADPDALITAHGVGTDVLHRMTDAADDPWRAAECVDSYGLDGCRYRYPGNTSEVWRGWLATDLARLGCRGKRFWLAELGAGAVFRASEETTGAAARNIPLPETPTEPLVRMSTDEMLPDDGRVPIADDVRIWNLTGFAAGATGHFDCRFRPLLDGTLFKAMGAYGMDGSRTPRSEMWSKLARWTNAPQQEALWRSRPVKGDIALLFVPEAEINITVRYGKSDLYANAAFGAYQGFFDNNIQADWIKIDQINDYDVLYVPQPWLLPQAICQALIAWVEKGGKLISEGCPGYFDETFHAGATQPWQGLDALFGVQEQYSEFHPDRALDLPITVGGYQTRCGVYLQMYRPTTGTVSGSYPDGRVAAVDNVFGQGKTRLIGTVPSYAYHRNRNAASKAFFASLLAWAGKEQHVTCSEPQMVGRLHAGEGGAYLWALNPSHEDRTATLELSAAWGPFSQAAILWGDKTPVVHGRTIRVAVGQRDGVIARLDK